MEWLTLLSPKISINTLIKIYNKHLINTLIKLINSKKEKGYIYSCKQGYICKFNGISIIFISVTILFYYKCKLQNFAYKASFHNSV